MSISPYDAYRPPQEPRGKRRRKNRTPSGGAFRRGGGDGSREVPVVPEPEFRSYYGRPIVKAPPWDSKIASYLFLGGLAGGSALLSLGGYFTDRPALRRNGRLGALGAASLGTVALIADLGRPERFLHMMRTVKPTSPMSLGSWLLAGFATNAGVAAAIEVDRMTDERLPLGPLRPVLHALELPTSVASGVLGAPLAAYTAVLLGDTAVPTWHEMHAHLPFVFVSSASLASGGFALVTTPVAETGPARFFAVAGVAGELAAMHVMKGAMDPVSVEPLEQGKPGAWLTWSERLSVIGGVGALLGGRRRWVAAASGLALMTSSALTRWGVFWAGKESVKDPRYTVIPQRNRLEKRRAAGITDDSITTAG
ncbi:polysulfide reductase NrfD [Kocuria indica]|uniref:NrfD/PsrC family molybdoenzyme membrane anchor subunit n=1 Tax=Kocuria marina TaxID=223184 RepID=UPI001EF58265|nr:NrfD/PsrC family molybdoenzyme membrane anchor subunit [Kocuria indica]MCG7432915.1 polysulfide reductase NrfD [Kocuria indica]